jgi:hypothetical protein
MMANMFNFETKDPFEIIAQTPETQLRNIKKYQAKYMFKHMYRLHSLYPYIGCPFPRGSGDLIRRKCSNLTGNLRTKSCKINLFTLKLNFVVHNIISTM